MLRLHSGVCISVVYEYVCVRLCMNVYAMQCVCVCVCVCVSVLCVWMCECARARVCVCMPSVTVGVRTYASAYASHGVTTPAFFSCMVNDQVVWRRRTPTLLWWVPCGAAALRWVAPPCMSFPSQNGKWLQE